MDFSGQPRCFLWLADDTPEVVEAREILKGPLGLAREVVCKMFRNDFEVLRNDLDTIKEFVAGINRAKSLSSYRVADYYSLMFAFQQWFHSSYRARQGKVLEAVIQRVLELHTSFDVKRTKKEVAAVLESAFGVTNISNADVDILGIKPNEKEVVVIQLRSRDDTGGTTAKGSLVDLLRDLLRSGKKPTVRILYLVGVWDERDSQQLTSTVRKIYSTLQEWLEISEGDFAKKIETGIPITKEILLRLAYGVNQIVDAIFEWDNPHGSHNTQVVKNIISTVEQWDDLWVSYAIASIELEIRSLTGRSNVALLPEKCNDLGIKLNFDSFGQLEKSIEEAIKKLIPAWSEETLPVRSPSDMAYYLRDLLFLWAIYQRFCPPAPEQAKLLVSSPSTPPSTEVQK